MVDEASYRKLALHVIVRAIKDLARSDKGRPINEGHRATQVYDAYTLHTAKRFVSDLTNDRLVLWCAWLRLDPKRVQTVARDQAWKGIL